nr:PREDICTED: uncharacterized protein LOC103278651 [Anolis carolinensis]|eukprot:XP_008107433.2 PREDICTED: uncharacterized protein LOC103278651 [Anolis carolinensis]
MFKPQKVAFSCSNLLHRLHAKWTSSLIALEQVGVFRKYVPVSGNLKQLQLHVFSDASNKAIAAVAYLRVLQGDQPYLGFVMGKAKLTPLHGHTMPRLELCAAVLATQLVEIIKREIDLSFSDITLYTDSKIVLGYIYNTQRRFHVYVSNRVDQILQITKPNQWCYISSESNPADQATREIYAHELMNSHWLKGPDFLKDPKYVPPKDQVFKLCNPEEDKEIRTLSTNISKSQEDLFSRRFIKFSSWKRLVISIAKILHFVNYKNNEPTSVEDRKEAESKIIQIVQSEVYKSELQCLRHHRLIPKSSTLRYLNPFLDSSGLIKVGGRLAQAKLKLGEKHPYILPAKHHISLLLIRHYHAKIYHQGRHFTEGAVRSAGIWIVGMKRLVTKVVNDCVICKRLRAEHPHQIMADLPRDRVTIQPPFTNVGVDIFGPWEIVTRRTRGGVVNNKRWAVMFTCLSLRAVHIELVESMDSTSFIYALQRFFAIRGPVKLLRSDCGTNFKGACKDLECPERSVLDPDVQVFLKQEGCKWLFNPPHASHMGGAWERMIGIVRRILDAMLLNVTILTHEILITLMAEVMSIINSRPLTPISTDPEDPNVLTPATLLTFKTPEWKDITIAAELKNIHRKQWQQVQSLANTFWKRWKREYLPLLQRRSKWEQVQENLRIGDIVLMKEKDTPRRKWPLAVITQVIPGGDHQVRKVRVKTTKTTGSRILERPITDLVLLFHRNEPIN